MQDRPDPGSLEGEKPTHFEKIWALHALRYALIAAAVSLWLWEGGASGGVSIALACVAAVLALDIPLHGPRSSRYAAAWSAVQIGAGLAALWLSPGPSSGLVLNAIVAGAAVVLPWRQALAGTLVAMAAVLLVLPAQRLETFLLAAGVALFLWLGHLFALRLQESQRHRLTVGELEAAQQRIAELAEASRELAVQRERQRLSAEIHDTLGHALVGTLLQVQIARKLTEPDPAGAARRLEDVEKTLRDTLDDVRRALRRGLHDGSRQLPLHLALEDLAEDFQASGGPAVELAFNPDGPHVSDLPKETAHALYRVAQEALTNAVRHGKARRVRVEADVIGPRLALRIRDDGVGAEQFAAGLGMTGMIERVQSVGGTLRFQTAPGAGFQIEVGVRRRR